MTLGETHKGHETTHPSTSQYAQKLERTSQPPHQKQPSMENVEHDTRPGALYCENCDEKLKAHHDKIVCADCAMDDRDLVFCSSLCHDRKNLCGRKCVRE